VISRLILATAEALRQRLPLTPPLEPLQRPFLRPRYQHTASRTRQRCNSHSPMALSAAVSRYSRTIGELSVVRTLRATSESLLICFYYGTLVWGTGPILRIHVRYRMRRRTAGLTTTPRLFPRAATWCWTNQLSRPLRIRQRSATTSGSHTVVSNAVNCQW
jgi:hypothetical protein